MQINLEVYKTKNTLPDRQTKEQKDYIYTYICIYICRERDMHAYIHKLVVTYIHYYIFVYI